MQKRQPQGPSTRLDVRAFARKGGTASGTVPLTEFARVAAECVDGGAGSQVTWSARGQLRGGDAAPAAPWLHLQADAALPLVCQRCLEPVSTPVAVDRWFRFAPDERTAEQQDDEASEDVLVESAEFDLRSLVEDELVLAMPLIASHRRCPTPPRLSTQDAGFDAPQETRPKPLAALTRLRLGKDRAED